MLLVETHTAARERPHNGIGPWEKLALALLLAALAGALAFQAWTLGITVDEPSHLLSSHLYWQGADRLKPRDMPPLIKMVCGWAPGLFPILVPFDINNEKETRSEWDLSQVMLDRMHRPSIRPMFFLTRLTLAVFPLLTTALIWFWGRRLWGAGAALFLALAYAAEPTALGHGAFIKNDVAATFTYLLFWFSLWAFWRSPSAARAAGVGAATLLALLSKLSMVWLFGVAPAVVLARMLLAKRRFRQTTTALALVLLIPYLGVLAAYQFETRRIPAFELDALGHDPLLPKPVLAVSQIFRVIPVAIPMWQGVLSLIRNNGQASPVYMLGSVYPEGSIWYFPVALAVKAPLILMILAIAGLLLIGWGAIRRAVDVTAVFWTVPLLLYLGLASLSSLQLGVRLVLPALPFGLLIAGGPVRWLLHSRIAAAVGMAAVWLVVQSATIYPNGISFFNVLSGGPSQGLSYLSDSNLDWGQGLPELSRFVHTHQIPSVHLAYFGNDLPWRFFEDREVEGVPVPWSDGLVPDRVYEPDEGYYAISATLLSGQFFPPEQRDYFAAFREKQPLAVLANSIYLYKVD